MTGKLFRLVASLALAALLAAGGAAPTFGARQEAEERLTPEERREAGEFLLALDGRWREAANFPALFDEAFVGDYAEVSRAESGAIPFAFLDESLRGQLTAAELRRAHVIGLDFIYVAGRLKMAFARREMNRKEAKRAAASRPSGDGRELSRGDEEDPESSPEEILSPAVVEEFRRSPLLSSSILEERGGELERGEGEDLNIATREQLADLLSTLERATPKMRARARELEAGLPGGAPSAVAREDDGEGAWPDLELTTYEAGWENRPAGTRVVCGYVSALQVCLAKEGGRYKVLAAYMTSD